MSDSQAPKPLQDDEGLFDELVEGCVSEIDNALESYASEEGVDFSVIDRALYTCAVQHAVDMMLDRDEFLDLIRQMFDDTKEIDALERRMCLTRGDA